MTRVDNKVSAYVLTFQVNLTHRVSCVKFAEYVEEPNRNLK